MAQIYSLICWGGKNGLSVTVSSSTDYVTLNGHGLHDGTAIAFTSGTLPSVSGTALSLNTSYYSKSISATTFELYYDSGLTSKINFTSNGSSLIMKSNYYLSLSDKTRWTYSGTEYIYDSMTNWVSGRSTADINDTEICEIGMAWDDETGNNGLTVSIPCGEIIITTMVNGVRSSGFHNGIVGVEAASGAVGYRLFRRTPQNSRTLNLSQARTTIDGFTVWNYSGMSGYTVTGIEIGAGIIKVKYMIVHGRGNYTATGIAFTSNTTYSDVANCIVLGGWSSGINVFQYRSGISVSNCFVTDCTTGMASYGSTNATGSFINNISIGNTTNWGTTSGFTKARNNAGLSTDSPWDSVGGTAISLATTDFTNFANKDFTPNTSSSPQVDSGVDFYGSAEYIYDIAGNERPSYNNGGTEIIDVGPYEFDLGYGNHPSINYYGLAFTGLISGSFLKVFTSGTDTELYSTTSSGTNETWSVNSSSSATIDYVIMKIGYLPIRVTGIVVTGGPDGILTTPINQQIDRAYNTSSGLTLNTNCYANPSTKKWGLTTTSTLQNFYSYLIEQWITLGDSGEVFANKKFPLSANGPNSFSWLDGWEADLTTYSASITNLSRDGMRYLNSSSIVTASWAAILTSGVPSGARVRYQQSDGGTTNNAIVTSGDMNELLQIYGDTSHGNFNYTNYLVLKVQKMGYDQAEADVITLYGTLEDQLYVVGLTPLVNNVATGNPSLASPPTITDHGASPVTWNGKSFSITITDSGDANSGTNIMKWLRYYFETGGTFQSKNAFDWHDLVQTNSSNFKTVRGKLYGDTGATLKGVRVVKNDGTTAHPDFTLFTADDGTTYSPPVYNNVSITGLVANSRLQIYNTTTATEIYNGVVSGTSYTETYTEGSNYSEGDVIRIRATYCVGTTAKLGWTTNVVVGASGWSALVSQENDTVYNTNAVDGSLISKFTADFGNDEIDLAANENFTSMEGYAFFVNSTYSALGIEQFFGGVTALDAGNYRINTNILSLYFDNTTTASKRQTDTARIFRSDEVYPVKDPTTSGYGIDINWKNVVYVVTVATGDAINQATVQAAMTAQGYTTARAPKIDKAAKYSLLAANK